MAPLLAIAAKFGLDFVTDLIADKGEALVTEGIKKVTGIDLTKKEPTPEEVRKINDHKLAIMQLDFEKLKLELDAQKEENRHDEARYTKAHDTYQSKSGMADRIAEQIIKFNLPVIFFLVVINIVVVHSFKENPTLIAIASNIIGVAIGHLFNERQAIVNFFFGSSIGSKEKDAHMAKAANKYSKDR